MSSSPSQASRILLACGIIAGPFYILVGFVQILIRDGFDPSRHPLSVLSLGPLGWIQISNFIITGILLIAFAIGLRQALRLPASVRAATASSLPPTTRGRTWAPILIGFYGAMLIASGIFIADPMPDFPPPPHIPTAAAPAATPEPSASGALHFMAGGLGFLAFIAASIILARRFAALHLHPLAVFSGATAFLFLAGFIAIATSGGAPWANIAFTIAVVLSWAWLSTVAAHFLSRQGPHERRHLP